jgi:hypothetical protein|nr:MAG: hypothetical protein [Caudoviricetes sp.]
MAITKNEYINNQDFLNALIEYKKNIKECESLEKPKPRIPDYIGECFLKISNNLAKRPNFYSYTYKDEMISDAIENCLMYFENFDPEKSSNPFAYFTQICWYAFIRRIDKEKKQQYIKYKATESFGILDEEELRELGDDSRLPQMEIYENMYDFISTYESKDEKKKADKKTKGIELFLE